MAECERTARQRANSQRGNHERFEEAEPQRRLQAKPSDPTPADAVSTSRSTSFRRSTIGEGEESSVEGNPECLLAAKHSKKWEGIGCDHVQYVAEKVLVPTTGPNAPLAAAVGISGNMYPTNPACNMSTTGTTGFNCCASSALNSSRYHGKHGNRMYVR